MQADSMEYSIGQTQDSWKKKAGLVPDPVPDAAEGMTTAMDIMTPRAKPIPTVTSEEPEILTLSSVHKVALLDELLETNNRAVWLAVARCLAATRTHLTGAARLCTHLEAGDYYQTQIAEAILEHPTTNDMILAVLCDAKNFAIWVKVAQASRVGKRTLRRLIRNCRQVEEAAHAHELAQLILSCRELDDEMLSQLTEVGVYAVWCEMATSEYAGKLTLMRLAQQCAKINCNPHYATEIAQDIINHSQSDDDVLSELCAASYTDIPSLVAMSPKAGVKTLTKLAEVTANAEQRDQYFACAIAKIIIAHQECTPEMIRTLLAAKLVEVREIAEKAHDKLMAS